MKLKIPTGRMRMRRKRKKRRKMETLERHHPVKNQTTINRKVVVIKAWTTLKRRVLAIKAGSTQPTTVDATSTAFHWAPSLHLFAAKRTVKYLGAWKLWRANANASP
jgi:hypothetical protein